MNDIDTFRDLALRVLENPRDEALHKELAAGLRAHPEWTDLWRSLCAEHALAGEAAHAADARARADRTQAIPADRLASALASVSATPPPATSSHSKRPLARRTQQLALAASLAIMASAALWFWRAPSPHAEVARFDPQPWLARATPSLARALTAPIATLVADARLPALRDEVSPFVLRSPLLATSAGPVVIAWKGDGLAHLTVLEGGRPLWSAQDAASGTRTPALPADRVYELVLTPAAGGAPSRERFVTVAVAPPPHAAPSLSKVLDAATAEPARLGDALLDWLALPAEIRRSEPGLRIGIWLGVEARQADVLAEARSALEAKP